MPSEIKAPLTDSILIAVSQLVDDAQTERREPSHSDIEFQINRAQLTAVDPNLQGQTLGKAKRLRAVLNWAMENNLEAGSKLISGILASIKGFGGFRQTSPNYVGAGPITNAISVFKAEGYELSLDGELAPLLLDGMAGLQLTEALQAYVRRAKKGASDAALVTGAGKDLLEAIAAHILTQREGGYEQNWNFPMLLGRAFMALGMATPAHKATNDEPITYEIDRAIYALACAVNRLRNKQGTGHGRPWSASVTDEEARFAIEAMGVIGERMLVLHEKLK